MNQVQTLEVSPAEDGMRLDRWFKVRFPQLGHGKLQKMLRTGQVRVDGGRAKANLRIETAQLVRVPPIDDGPGWQPTASVKKRITAEEQKEVQSWVVHQDDHLIVINKPAGLAAQGGSGTKKHVDGFLEALQFNRDERPRLVHRLDKDTSGVMLIARSRKAAAWYAEVFKSKEAHKLYWALVVGAPRPREGLITLPLSKQLGVGGERMVVDQETGKFARTAYRILESAGQKVSWVAFQPVTGRTHQIRIHSFEGLGAPILGDGKYGGEEAHVAGLANSKKMHLHARAIQVPNMAGGTLEVYAPPAAHFIESCRFLGFQAQPEYDWILETD
ncbi:MAG: RluA family pseudouridine synthase [Rhodospirillales bacterium]|nr:RluA family pseudouridine synthase [Rhodospirillales bacterium]